MKQRRNQSFADATVPKSLRDIQTTQAGGRAVWAIGVSIQTADAHEESVLSDREQTFSALVESVASRVPISDQPTKEVETFLRRLALQVANLGWEVCELVKREDLGRPRSPITNTPAI